MNKNNANSLIVMAFSDRTTINNGVLNIVQSCHGSFESRRPKIRRLLALSLKSAYCSQNTMNKNQNSTIPIDSSNYNNLIQNIGVVLFYFACLYLT